MELARYIFVVANYFFLPLPTVA